MRRDKREGSMNIQISKIRKILQRSFHLSLSFIVKKRCAREKKKLPTLIVRDQKQQDRNL